jgi:hypothetical protein
MRKLSVALLVLIWGSSVFARSAAAETAPDFGRDVRPILADKCFTCHGPSDANREAGLRLDDQESAFGEADSGLRAIVPGKPDASELVARITSDDEFTRMPPPDAEKQLTAEEIKTLTSWIAAGAEWQAHWAFVPPVSPEVPSLPADGAANEIDAFIRARLQSEGLTPNSTADRTTLLRRVTLDLTGLPPSMGEVEAFLADESPDAYEKVVDRLLRSPRYGEHMARYWLDAARYGDTHGLHLDNYREMWPYRDWVIQAFNQNLPYDQFVIEQLAGDLLPNPTRQQLIATGFNRSHVTTNEGGSIKEEVYVRNVVDRVVTTGTVFMGLTLECTRCHDHKYDPLTMKDFYSLFAYFNSLDGDPMDGNRKDPAPVIRVPTDEQERQLEDLAQQIAAVEQKLKDPWDEIDGSQQAWEASVRAQQSAASENATIRLDDWYTVGPFPDNRRYLYARKHGPEGQPVDLQQQYELATGDKVAWEKRPEWQDGKVHTDLAGDLAANFLYRQIISPDERTITVSLGSDDALKVYFNGKQVLANDVARGAAADQEKLELKLKAGENQLLLKVMNYGGATGFYFRVESDTTVIPEDIAAVLKKPAGDLAAEEQAKLREFYRFKIADIPALEEAKSELARLREERAAVERQIPTTLIWREKAEPVPAFVLKRGEYDQQQEPRPRATPSSLPGFQEDWPNNRLGLALWLVAPEHPLTARVAVNRFWQQLFGTGLVKTSEDFGTRGDPPSHPRLLDWLAVQFIQDGWDVKRTMKRMVMSSTYRQSSRVTPELLQRDPANRLLARGPRYRLDAEMLRDQALFVSDLLVERIGGPSVKPPQPDGLWYAVGYTGSNTVRFKADEGLDKVHRRTVYTFIKRTAPPPQMSTFDGPSREACSVRRERTNTPLQSLLLFNDPQYVEAARGLAQRTMREAGPEHAARAAHMFQLCTCRPPTDEELRDLVAGFEADLATYRQDLEAARQLVGVGTMPTDEELDASELAAWTLSANLLLNLDEVLTKN